MNDTAEKQRTLRGNADWEEVFWDAQNVLYFDLNGITQANI